MASAVIRSICGVERYRREHHEFHQRIHDRAFGHGGVSSKFGIATEWRVRFLSDVFQLLPSDPAYRQDRDLTQYSSLGGYVRNDTSVPLTFSLEIKDYRDSNSEKATRSYTIPAGGTWTPVSAPLDLSNGWTVTGTPDLTRTFAVSFLVNANSGAASGSLYLDDFDLTEKGGSLDPTTAPIHDVVERLAKPILGTLGCSQ